MMEFIRERFVEIRRENMRDSHEATKARRDKEAIAAIVVDCAFHLHRDLGPSLLESVYEILLAKIITEHGLTVERQKPIPIRYSGYTFDEGFRADLLVDGVLRVFVPSCESDGWVEA